MTAAFEKLFRQRLISYRKDFNTTWTIVVSHKMEGTGKELVFIPETENIFGRVAKPTRNLDADSAVLHSTPHLLLKFSKSKFFCVFIYP